MEKEFVILKQKEYNDLLKQAKENKPKMIRIEWNYYGREEIFSESFIFGEKLKDQIKRIHSHFDSYFEKNYIRIMNEGKAASKCVERKELLAEFEKLPWYKRLFFNKKYLFYYI